MSILDMVSWVHELVARGNKIAFTWLPSRVGVGSNSAADAGAKGTLSLAASAVPIPFYRLPVRGRRLCATEVADVRRGNPRQVACRYANYSGNCLIQTTASG
jgi:hypothetical protein